MQNQQLDHSRHPAPNRKFPLCFIAHNITDPMNVGSLFRIADALGVEKIWLSGMSPQPPNGKIKRTSRSCEKYVAWAYRAQPFELIAQLKAEGYLIVSLEISSASIDIRDLSLQGHQKIALVLGSENEGVSQVLLDVSDVTAHIPMLGQNSSMNVANACAIASFELLRFRAGVSISA
jgi:tRNA G18 (ribose-2'-O)-methylase SpoU